MSANGHTLELRTSPHAVLAQGVDTIMFHVLAALAPIVLFAVYVFGLSALLLVFTTTAVCMVTERAVCALTKSESTLPDYSVAITGLLLGLTLPPGFPLWMAAVGSAIAVLLGKAVFGGLGHNAFNPALVGRAFLQAAFPTAITTWTPAFAPGRFTSLIPSTLTFPFSTPVPVDSWIKAVAIDGFSGATPLAMQKFEHVTTGAGALALGMTSGSAGETSALLILLCGAYLAVRRFMDWRIPAAMLLAAFATSAAFYLLDPKLYPSPVFTLFAGGLMLGAVFMASDMVASPVTPLGVWIYGGLMGFLTVVIRLKGGLPEGVMYAILLGNAVSPIIDNVTQPRVYGARRTKAKL